MSDPAVEAAQRAWESTSSQDDMGWTLNPYATAKSAAREALAPIREVLVQLGEDIDNTTTVSTAFQHMVRAINTIEKHVFTTEELTDD